MWNDHIFLNLLRIETYDLFRSNDIMQIIICILHTIDNNYVLYIVEIHFKLQTTETINGLPDNNNIGDNCNVCNEARGCSNST